MIIFKRYLYILSFCSVLLIASAVSADDDLDIQQAIAEYKERSWEFGVSAGYGARTNPLINSHDVPLYLIFNMAWFGDWVFFDNGDLGLNFYEGDRLSLNLITHLNNERSVFEWFNKGVRVFGVPTAGTALFDNNSVSTEGHRPIDQDATVATYHLAEEPLGPEYGVDTNASIEIPHRKLAVDAGLEVLYTADWGELQMQFLSDISFRHKGFEIWGSYSYPWQFGNLLLTPSVGFVWKSSGLLNYYYGVRYDEAQPSLSAYQARSGTNAFVRLAAVYNLSNHWGVVGVVEYESLSTSIQHSPFVDKKSIQTYFIGLTYQF
jgi:outer membrane protein